MDPNNPLCPKKSCQTCPVQYQDGNCPPPRVVEITPECQTPAPTAAPTKCPDQSCPPIQHCHPCQKTCPPCTYPKTGSTREGFQNFTYSYLNQQPIAFDKEANPKNCLSCRTPVECPAEDCSLCPKQPLQCGSQVIYKSTGTCAPIPSPKPQLPCPTLDCPQQPDCPTCELTCAACPPAPTACPTQPPVFEEGTSRYCGKYINTGCDQSSGTLDYLTSEILVKGNDMPMRSGNCASGYVPGMYSLIEDRGVPLIARGSTYSCPSLGGNCFKEIPNTSSGICKCKPKNFVENPTLHYNQEESESGDLIYIRCGGGADSDPGGIGNNEWWGDPVINSEHYGGTIPSRNDKTYTCAELCEKNYEGQLSDEAGHRYYIPGIDKIVRLHR